MEFMKNLKKLLKEHRFTIEMLAKKANVSQANIKAWLSGTHPRKLDDVKRVAEVLGVSFEFLIFGEETRAEKSLEQQMLQGVFEGYLKVKIEKVVKIKPC